MPTRNINLTGHYNQFVKDEINKGYYNNASEVIRAGIHLLECQRLKEEAKLGALQAAAEIGFKDVDNGNYTQINSGKELSGFFSKIEDEVDQRHKT